MKLESWHGPNRRVRILTPEHAEDIIKNCKSPKDDAVFAKKYNVTIRHIIQIRLGQRWKWLRDKISASRDNTSVITT